MVEVSSSFSLTLSLADSFIPVVQGMLYRGSLYFPLKHPVLNRAETIPLFARNGEYTDPSSPEPLRETQRRGAEVYEASGTNYTTRDVAWHGYEPTLMSTCWEVDGGYRRGGTIAKHEWKGLGKGGMRRLEDWVEKKKAENRDCGVVG